MSRAVLVISLSYQFQVTLVSGVMALGTSDDAMAWGCPKLSYCGFSHSSQQLMQRLTTGTSTENKCLLSDLLEVPGGEVVEGRSLGAYEQGVRNCQRTNKKLLL